MRFLFILLLLYLFSIIHLPLDISFILLSFSALYDKKMASMILALFAGFLQDLYTPSYLGAGMLSYLISIYFLIWMKRYIQMVGYFILPLAFSGLILKFLLFSILTRTPFPPLPIIFTALTLIPSFPFLSKILYKRWHLA